MSKSTRKQPAKTTPSTPNAAKRLAMYDRVFAAINKVAAIRREIDSDNDVEHTDWTIHYKYIGSQDQGYGFVVETDISINEFNPDNLHDTDSLCYADFTALETELNDREERAKRKQNDAELREKTLASLSREQRRVLGLNNQSS
jgi:hypothetical protein